MVNNTWATAIELPPYGSVSYTATNTELHYKFTPPKGVPMTISVDAIGQRVELYYEGNTPADAWIYPITGFCDDPLNVWLWTPNPSYEFTYHFVVYSNLSTIGEVHKLSWGLPDWESGHWSDWQLGEQALILANDHWIFSSDESASVRPIDGFGNDMDGMQALAISRLISSTPKAYGINPANYGFEDNYYVTTQRETRDSARLDISGQHRFEQYEVPEGWETQTNQPKIMDTWEKGVRYIDIPGTHDRTQFSSTELNTWGGWTTTPDDGTPIVYGIELDYHVHYGTNWGTANSISWILQFLDGGTTWIPRIVGSQNGDEVTVANGWPAGGSGIVVASGAVGNENYSQDGSVFVNPETQSFALFPKWDHVPAHDPAGFITSGMASVSFQLGHPDIRAVITFRPWRYWIPELNQKGIPPMRQRHRDDGLATDARQMVGSGSSLQSSIRRGGQVYY